MKRNDLILIVILLIIGGAFASVQILNKKPGKKVVVMVDGREQQVLKLEQEQQVKIICKDGHYNLLRISDGRASITEADCKNQKCVYSHSIQDVGESITCLPHKVIVKVVAE